MPEPVGWRHYPVGPPASLARAAGAAVISIPLVAILMVLPFLAIRYVAEKGAFGMGAVGRTWVAWAEAAVGVAVLAFAVGTFTASLFSFVRTVATISALRRAIRRGARGTDVPHPQQWAMATEWSGATVIISALLMTAILAFPGMLTTPVRPWVEGSWVSEPVVLVSLPVVSTLLVVLYRIWRAAPLRELEGRWTEELRSAAAATASARVPILPTDADGEPVNPATSHRTDADAAGDRVNSAGLVLSLIAVITAIVTLPAGTSIIGSGVATTTAEKLTLLSSVLLLAIAIVLYVLGGLLQNAAQSAELRGLLAAARRPYGPSPTLSVLARYWKPLDTPWVDFLGLVGALLLLGAVPALLLPGSGAAQNWGAVGGVVAFAALLAAIVVDAVSENSTRESRNLVLRRWPVPDPTSMNKKGQVDTAIEADVERYGQMSAVGQQSSSPRPGLPPVLPVARGPAGSFGTAANAYPPPTGSPVAPAVGAYPAPASAAAPGFSPPPHAYAVPASASTPGNTVASGAMPGLYPEPSAQSSPPAGQYPLPPPQPRRGQRAWGLPKRLRDRGLGHLYR